MPVQGRGIPSSLKYRYGFNGMEDDREVYGPDNTSLDYDARIYNSRIGKWLSIDPSAPKYSDKTPYGFCSQNPINRVDINGEDDIHFYKVTTSIWLNNPMAGFGEKRKVMLSQAMWYTVTPTETKNTYTYHCIQNVFGEKGAQQFDKRLDNLGAGNAIIEFGLDKGSVSDNSQLASFRPQEYSDAGDIANKAAFARRKNFETKANVMLLGLVASVVSEGFLSEVAAGAGAAELLQAAKAANGGYSTIYRAVSKAELDDIVKFGFRNKPGAYETGKLFAPTLKEAAKFGKNNFSFDGFPNTIMQVRVPNRVLNGATRFGTDGMNAISIPADQLNFLKATPLNFSPFIR